MLGVIDSLKIPKTNNIAFFDYSGLGLGKATLTFSAPFYNSVSGTVIVTSPILRQGGIGTSYNTTSPPVTTYVYAEDTIGYAHYTLDSVAVRVTSSDTTVLKVDSAKIHIFKGNYQSTNENVRFVGPGTAYIVYKDSANLYHADSTAPITVAGPVLRISAGGTLGSPVTLGMRQHLGVNGMYVYVDNTVTGSPVTVNLVSTDPTVATVPATTTIPVGSNVGYFDITALDTTGTIQIKLSATGYAPVVSFVQVGQPQFQISAPTSVYTTSPPSNTTVYAEDQVGNLHYTTENVVVTLTSSNTTVAAPDSATITIVKDNYYHNTSKMIYKSAGTTVLTASDARVKYYKYQPANTGTITVAHPDRGHRPEPVEQSRPRRDHQWVRADPESAAESAAHRHAREHDGRRDDAGERLDPGRADERQLQGDRRESRHRRAEHERHGIQRRVGDDRGGQRHDPDQRMARERARPATR